MALTSLIFSSTVRAEGRCPPGMFPTGGGTAGWEACAPIPGAPPPDDSPVYSPDIAPEPPPQQADPMQARVNLAIDTIKLMELNRIREEELLKDPKYQAYLKGAWEFFPSQDGTTPGKYCGALFWNKDGLVGVLGPLGDDRSALLTFLGPDIPRPQKPQTIKVKLSQSTLSQPNLPPKTVRAFNYAMPDDKYGTIAFAVPTLEAGLEGMEDVQSFEVAIDDRTVLKIKWHSGMMARDRLRQCADGLAASQQR